MVETPALGFHFDPAGVRIDWDSGASILAVNPEWLRRDREAVLADCAALPDLAGHVFLATSGSSAESTGRIRWVGLSKHALLASAAAVNAHLQATSADVWAHALPVFHVGGLGILARAHLAGAAVASAVETRWDARRFHQRVREVHATLTALVPSQLHDLVGAGLRAPATLRAVIVGGARLDPELCIDARRLGWPCLPSYGLTETASQIATAPIDSGLTTECTGPVPLLRHAQARADDSQRLVVKADSLLTCYAERAPGGLRVWDPKRDGWLTTDDLGRVTLSGIEVFGRAVDSVKVLGEMVSLGRVEEAVRRWASAQPPLAGTTADVAVVALPEARLGHEIVAVVAAPGSGHAAPSAAWESLAAFCREALLPYEQPRRIAWVEAIPRTALGKCRRALLAQEVLLQAGAHR